MRACARKKYMGEVGVARYAGQHVHVREGVIMCGACVCAP